MAIQSFGDRRTRRFNAGEFVPNFQSFERQARLRLRNLNGAVALRDLSNVRSNRLERLRGDRAGQYSIRINRQWRICFSWIDGQPHEVEIVDYH